MSDQDEPTIFAKLSPGEIAMMRATGPEGVRPPTDDQAHAIQGSRRLHTKRPDERTAIYHWLLWRVGVSQTGNLATREWFQQLDDSALATLLSDAIIGTRGG